MGQHQADQRSHYETQKTREKGAEKLFDEIMAEKFPNLGKEPDIQIQETHIVPN